MVIQPTVDLSGAFGSARDQGQRSTCMAFAMSDLNRVTADAPDVLSAEFLYQTAGALIPGWQPGMGLFAMAAIQATAAPGQPIETTFPYLACESTSVGTPIAPVGAHVYNSRFCIRHRAMQSVIDELTHGVPVGLVMRVTPGLFNPADGIVAHEMLAIPNAYHAVLAVGWGTDPTSGVRYLLIRNSWGPAWALAGHAWLPEPFIDLHVLEAFGR